MSTINEQIETLVKGNEVVLFMKGTPMFPQCGFSARAVGVLQHLGAKFAHVNVLADGEMREGIKAYSNWPTIPQLYIKGEFVGGSDIMMSLFEAGDLQKKLAGE